MNESHSTAALIDCFLESFNRGDLGAMRSALAGDAVAFVTGPDGNSVRLEGADMYIAALGAMDLTNADYSVELTQAPMFVGADQALIMTETRARRGGKTLHNFAAHLLEGRRRQDRRAVHGRRQARRERRILGLVADANAHLSSGR
jgi:hypothetical protein